MGEKVSEAYVLHKVGTQLGGGVLQAGAMAFRDASEYATYTSRHAGNPGEDIFLNDRAVKIYDGKSLSGKAFQRIFLPSSLRKHSFSPVEMESLENIASRNFNRMKVLGPVAATVETASNLGAMALCLKEGNNCTPQEWATFAFSGLSSAAFIPGFYYQGKGAFTGNYETLNLARRLFILMNVAQIAGGVTKMGIEFYHAAAEPEHFSLAAMVNGGLHVGMGGSWFILNTYYAREAAAFVRVPETFQKGIDVLRVHGRVIPTKLLWSARIFGMLGPMIGATIGISDIHEGMTNVDLEKASRNEKIISGLLGTASSACFIGFAFFMTPAAIPLGTALLTGGFFLLAIQTAYDEREAITAFFKGPAPDFGTNPLSEAYYANLYGREYKSRIQTGGIQKRDDCNNLGGRQCERS